MELSCTFHFAASHFLTKYHGKCENLHGHNYKILITGTTKGIGDYLAKYYVKKGHTVFGCGTSKSKFFNDNYIHYCLDVRNEKSVKKMLTEIRKKYGRIDILINNAGIASMNHSMMTTLDKAKKILDVNILGTFLFCRESAKIMKRNN